MSDRSPVLSASEKLRELEKMRGRDVYPYLLNALSALREAIEAAERVERADNQSLGMPGKEGDRAMNEMIDALTEQRAALAALSVALKDDNP